MQDLEPDDVMLLDTFDEVFVWVGNGANDAEKKAALQMAFDYVASPLGGGRSVDSTALLVVKQGREPPSFTAHFPGWDRDFWTVCPIFF